MSTNASAYPKSGILPGENITSKLVDLALQISHDIRSPIAALEIVIDADKTLGPESKELLKGIALRIREISNAILTEYSESHALPKVIDIRASLESVLIEKRHEFSYLKNVLIRYEKSELGPNQASKCTVSIDNGAFKTAMSNLINNAIEAVSNRIGAVVDVSIKCQNGFVEIIIGDNGRGMDNATLSKFGQKGKPQGRNARLNIGLGSYQAKTCIESAKGKLFVQSALEKGTQVQIVLPTC